jgi:hypothetical protein
MRLDVYECACLTMTCSSTNITNDATRYVSAAVDIADAVIARLVTADGVLSEVGGVNNRDGQSFKVRCLINLINLLVVLTSSDEL